MHRGKEERRGGSDLARCFAVTAGAVLALTMLLLTDPTNAGPMDRDSGPTRGAKETFLADSHLLNSAAGISAVSPDNKRVAYRAYASGKYFVVVDGKDEKRYDGIANGSLVFSPDSRRLSYLANLGDKYFVVVDGKEGKRYDGIGKGSLVFSPDSARVAYGGLSHGKYFVVVDGKEGKHYDAIANGSLVFSPDSARVAYGAYASGKWFVVVDGNEGKSYEGMVAAPVFSPDSRRVGYRASVGGKWFVVLDGKEGKPYDGMVAASLFSPDGTKVAYGACASGKYFVVADGKEGKRYDGIGGGTPVFSSDSRRVAYGAYASGRWFVVVDGKEGKPYEGIGKGTLLFSPDGARVAYGARANGESFVVVDEKEGKPYDGIMAAPMFSPDSRRLAYGALSGGKCFVVVDEEEGKAYDNLLPGGRIVFDSSDSLHYLAQKNGVGVYLVEEVIVPPNGANNPQPYTRSFSLCELFLSPGEFLPGCLDHCGHHGDDDYGNHDDGEVAPDHGYVAEEEAAQREDEDPRDAACHVVGDETCIGHAADACHEGGEGPYDGHEAGDDDGLSAVFLIEPVSPVKVVPVEPTGASAREDLWPYGASDEVIEVVSRHCGETEGTCKPYRVEGPEAGEGACREKQGITGEERGYHETRLAEDDEKEEHVRPEAVLPDDGPEVGVEMHEYVEAVFYQIDHVMSVVLLSFRFTFIALSLS